MMRRATVFIEHAAYIATALGEPALQGALKAGRALIIDQMVALAYPQ